MTNDADSTGSKLHKLFRYCASMGSSPLLIFTLQRPHCTPRTISLVTSDLIFRPWDILRCRLLSCQVQKLSGSGTRRTPRHTWSTEQKRCLVLLFERYQLEPEKIATTFNSVFRSEIDPKGFPSGLPYTSLRKQFQERKQADNVSWSKITRPECAETEARRREELAERIQCCLASVNGDASNTVSEVPLVFPHFKEAPVYTPVIDGATTRTMQMVAISRSEVIDRFSYMAIDDDDEEEQAPRTPVKQIRTGRLATAEPAPLTPPKRSPKSMPTGFTRTGADQPPGMQLFKRPSGPSIWLYPQEMAIVRRGWAALSRQEAQPPLAGLFFRFWDADHSRAKMTSDGIVAEKYASSNCVPRSPPTVESLDWTDVLNHLDQPIKETPFVSVSDSLVWCLSKVLKKVKEGKKDRWADAQVSVIDAHALNSQAVFHALPYYRQLQATWALKNATARGVSAHEFLIWSKIPRQAIIKTFAVKEIYQAAASSAALGQILRLDVLSVAGDYQQTLRPRPQQGNTKITASVASGIAQVALFIGLNHHSPFESHRYIANNLISSYKMLVTYHDAHQWRDIAAHYSHALCRESITPVSAKDQALLKLAFLEGVRLGAAHDFKLSRIDAKTVAAVQRKAALIGLEDPGRIVSGEADAVKLHVGLEQKRQWKVFECRPSQMLLEDEPELDGGSVFEMDEDGVVV